MVRSWLARLWPFSSGTGGGGDGEADGSDADGPEDTRVWDFIPSWQYDGWQSHTGGLTVDEQERALRDVQEQAGEIEEVEALDRETARRDSSTRPDE